jgi:hypothetical protein
VVNTSPADYGQPALAMDAAGRIVATWASAPRPGTFIDVAAQRFQWGTPLPAERFGRVLDFHADGRSDLLWSNSSTGAIYLWRMNGGTATAFTPVATVGDTHWTIAAGGDFDGDSRADLAWHHDTTGQVYLWLMNGATIASVVPVATVPDLNWKIVASGDTDADGRADFVWRNTSTHQVYVWRMNGTSIVSSSPLPYLADSEWTVLAMADVDGDGRSDALWRNRWSGEMTLFSTASGLQPYGITPVSVDWRVASTADLDGDRLADLLWRNDSTGQIYLWRFERYPNWPSSRVAVRSVSPVATVPDPAWRIVASGDLNADGKGDLVWRHDSTGQVYVWLMDGATIASVSFVATVADPSWALQALR